MLSMFDQIREAAQLYARYHQTRAEIARLPLNVALDLYPADADRIARAAVYGRTS